MDRKQLLRFYLRGIPHRRLDYDWLAEKTGGFSAADIAKLVRRAAHRSMIREYRDCVHSKVGMGDPQESLRENPQDTLATWFKESKKSTG